jgi:hypoxanthine-DNA glycosylase
VNVKSFLPIEKADARVLILGSMPGLESLRQQQYYAHPRNAFWPIMLNLLKLPSELDYSGKSRCLVDRHIALWDVLQSCIRPGSLDSAIDMRSVAVNDFNRFFQQHPHIRAIFFNGQKAESIFRQRVLPDLDSAFKRFHYQRLPSTSPAHAALSPAEKQRQWQAVLDYLSD